MCLNTDGGPFIQEIFTFLYTFSIRNCPGCKLCFFFQNFDHMSCICLIAFWLRDLVSATQTSESHQLARRHCTVLNEAHACFSIIILAKNTRYLMASSKRS